MTTNAPSLRSMKDLRNLTPARVGLGRAGAGLPTKALLDFTLDHARARDAVHAAFDAAAMISGLGARGLAAFDVSSAAHDRNEYLRRPDLGRKLDQASQRVLAEKSGRPCRLAIVVGDGLSPTAVNAHAIKLVQNLIPQLAVDGIEIGYAVVASGARVALADEIGAVLGARMMVMLIGERPGPAASESLGAYPTFTPRPRRTDAGRQLR